MSCRPGARVEIVKVAQPPLSTTVPSGVELSANVTVPVGRPDPSAKRRHAPPPTNAVKVTFWPAKDGFGPVRSVVELFRS